MKTLVVWSGESSGCIDRYERTCIDKLAGAIAAIVWIQNFIVHFLDLILKVLEYVHIVWYNKDNK